MSWGLQLKAFPSRPNMKVLLARRRMLWHELVTQQSSNQKPSSHFWTQPNTARGTCAGAEWCGCWFSQKKLSILDTWNFACAAEPKLLALPGFHCTLIDIWNILTWNLLMATAWKRCCKLQLLTFFDWFQETQETQEPPEPTGPVYPFEVESWPLNELIQNDIYIYTIYIYTYYLYIYIHTCIYIHVYTYTYTY